MTEEITWEFITDPDRLRELLVFWNKRALELENNMNFYKDEAAKAHELLGRVTAQFSEHWDKVYLTNYPRKRVGLK